MSNVRHIVEIAFRLHAEGRITREDLVSVVGQCINAVSLENGYAEKFGLPFPDAPDAEADRAP